MEKHVSSLETQKEFLRQQQPEVPTEPTPPTGFLGGLQESWMRLTSPNPRRFGTSMPEQEHLRRSHLLSVMLWFIPIALCLALPNAFAEPVLWLALGTLVVLGIGVGWLNRQGYLTAAGLLYITTVDIVVILVMVTEPNGITNSNISDFDLFLLTVLIGGLVLKRRYIPLLVITQIITIIVVFVVLPHDPLFTQEVNVHQNGLAYAELTDAFLLQILGGIIAWLGSWSVERALLRASRAEELAEARAHIELQAREIAAQKERLEQGIAALKEVQSKIANGDYSARASLQNNELFPLAISLNLMAERLSRFGRIEQDYQRQSMALQTLLDARTKLAKGATLATLRPTGTPIDQIITILNYYYHNTHIMAQGLNCSEEMRTILQQQLGVFMQLSSLLAEGRGLAQMLPEERPGARVQGESRQGMPSTILRRQDGHRPGEPVRTVQSEQYVKLFEGASVLCSQVRQSSTVCLQKVQQLSQLLSVDQG